MASEYRLYLDRLCVVAQTADEYCLKCLFRERLDGGGPPLQRDEGDLADILILAYRDRQAAGDQQAQERLRRVVADLLTETLRSCFAADPKVFADAQLRLDLLGSLVVWFGITKSDDGEVSDDLAIRLSGILDSRLPKPFVKLAELDGQQLDVAVRILDLWLALTCRKADQWPDHLKDTLVKLFEHTVDTAHNWQRRGEAKLGLLFSTFQATVFAQPFNAAAVMLPSMLSLLQVLEQQMPGVLDRWWGQCFELKARFVKNQSLQEKFADGAATLNSQMQLRRALSAIRLESHALIAQSLKSMGIDRPDMPRTQLSTQPKGDESRVAYRFDEPNTYRTGRPTPRKRPFGADILKSAA